VQNRLHASELCCGNASEEGPLKALPIDRSDVWALCWAEEDPKLFAMMDKNRLVIVQDLQAEEPSPTGSFLIRFGNLEAELADLSNIMADPEVCPLFRAWNLY
jgi:hypothetical protein